MVQVRFYTLGCKLNQLETESLAHAFRSEGFSLAPWEESSEGVNILVVNTCTVTSHAEQKARHVVRKALRDHPLGIILITGCYAQMEACSLNALDEETRRVFVIPGERKDSLLDLPAFLNKAAAGSTSLVPDNEGIGFLRNRLADWAALNGGGAQGSFRFRPIEFSFHSRAFVKIQDGCDNHCAFCRVNLARGKSRSRDAVELLADIKTLEEKGCREVVLTGVNISQYTGRAEDSGGFGLAGLLDYLLSGTEKIRLRLSSLESDAFVPDFMRVVSHTRIRPHFHLSIQSGSPGVLARMGRSGSLELFEEGIRRLRKTREDPFLACDIITGFPGETEFDFEQTYEFCLKTDFAWIHVFPFSRRPGTAAWNFKDRVSEREARLRLGRLTELARRGKSGYIRRWTGRELEFVPHSAAGKPVRGERPLNGVTANYLKVFFPERDDPPPEAEVLYCKITGEAQGEFEKRFDAAAEMES